MNKFLSKKISIAAFFALISIIPISVKGQKVSLTVGTDIPYQFYIGTTLETSKVDISYRTGTLVPPFSGIILNAFQKFGSDEIYIKLLDASYDFGWMNTLGVYYKFGEEKKWYLGPEFRLDYFTASDTPANLLEEITGINPNNGNSNNQQGKLSLVVFGLGLRSGYSFHLDKKNKHIIRAELSIAKYIATQSTLRINNKSNDDINDIVDNLLWEKVFKKYGFLGGVGVSYAYRF